MPKSICLAYNPVHKQPGKYQDIVAKVILKLEKYLRMKKTQGDFFYTNNFFMCVLAFEKISKLLKIEDAQHVLSRCDLIFSCVFPLVFKISQELKKKNGHFHV